MNTSAVPAPDVPLPPGAVAIDDWEGTPLGRAIQGINRGVTDSDAIVWTGACQLADGSVATTPAYLAPVINVELAQDLNSDQARELASALLEAADEVDRWVQR
jgi:hypothetical protein